MAFLGELGKKYPVLEQGEEVDLEDDVVEMAAGDIFEIWYDVEGGDLNADLVRDCIHETLFMKEEYPYFVLHHMKFESRRVYIQYSVAPVGQTGSPLLAIPIKKIVLLLMALIGVILAAALLGLAAYRGIILRRPPPVGHAEAWAKDMKYNIPLAKVKITGAGKTLTTGPNGEAVFFENLLIGNYTFVGETKAGYHPPLSQTATIRTGEVTNVVFQYYHLDQVPPTTGLLIVDTSPVKGEVRIGGVEYGEAPVGPIEFDAGAVVAVVFQYIEGWVTPEYQMATIPQGDTITIVGTYKKPGYDDDENWWEKYVRYALIGGGVIIGAAIVVPEVVRQIARRGGRD